MNSADSKSFCESILATIDKHKMLAAGDKVLAAVSGGPDSTAMIYVLDYIKTKLSLDLEVFHLDHMLRPESSTDSNHVRGLAKKLDLNATIKKRDVADFCSQRSLSIQEGARLLRYALMDEIAAERNFDKIAVGHNADDVVETFVMRLISGTGLTGLSSIPPVREERVIRPLIESRRSTIENFLSMEQISFLTDRSNNDRKYLRNQVRLDVIPMLTSLNPRFVEKTLSTIGLIRDEEQALRELTEETFTKLVKYRSNEVRIDAGVIEKAGPALGRRLVLMALKTAGSDLRRIDYAHVDGIWREIILERRRSKELPGLMRATIEDDELVLYKHVDPFPDTLIEPGKSCKIEDTLISVNIFSIKKPFELTKEETLTVDADQVEWPIKVRPWRKGDWFVPLGMTGKKKLQDFFVDSKVPKRHRSSIPIFSDKNKVVAIGGLRIDERVKVSDMTKRIAVIESPGVIK